MSNSLDLVLLYNYLDIDVKVMTKLHAFAFMNMHVNQLPVSSKLLVEHTCSPSCAIQYNTIIHVHKHSNNHLY
jgi:L-arabinose isomerase